jgi:ABC-type antimicrobial peptide transport system permease subunit
VLETLQTDLLTTGLIGLLLLSFVIALVLCAVSFATYAGITLQSRRTEFAVLRALGWPRRQIISSILAEQALVMITGVALGLGIGVFLSAQVLPALSGSDAANVLPYAVRADPEGLLFYVFLMAALLAFQLMIGTLVIGRQTAETLRAGGAE